MTTILIDNQTDSYKTPHILTKVSMVNIINTCLVTPYSLSHTDTSEKTGEAISGSLKREAARSPETSAYTTLYSAALPKAAALTVLTLKTLN